MPSRAGGDGLGAFSYYEHVFLPESLKELEWEHGGRTFKSQVVFRVNGKKKTDAFLFELDGEAWKPVRLPDGLVSDGKVETYERAVREILGPQETFFTSVFSAQGKRPLSAFKNGEIKDLLGDLLGLEHVRAQGGKATEVVKGLKAGLAVVRDRRTALDEQVQLLDRQLAPLASCDAEVAAAKTARAAAGAALAAAQQQAANLAVQAQAAAATEERRTALGAQRVRAQEDHERAVTRLKSQGHLLDGQERALAQRIADRRKGHNESRRALVQQRAKLVDVLARAGAVRRALRRLPLAQRVVELRRERLEIAEGRATKADQVRAELGVVRSAIQSIEREAGQVAIRHSDLQRRFGLAGEVPCAGSDLAGRCQLLGDAREAQQLLPSSAAQIEAFALKKAGAHEKEGVLRQALETLAGAADARNAAEIALERSEARVRSYELAGAAGGEVDRAQEAVNSLNVQLADLAEVAPAQTDGESAEARALAEARSRMHDETQLAASKCAEAVAQIDQELSKLPPAYSATALQQAQNDVAAAQKAVTNAADREAAAVQAVERKKALQEQRAGMQKERDAVSTRASNVEAEISAWSMLAKCLSNDGVIALDIDDAGPTFARLANELLLASYGARFTLEVTTQTSNAKGELREDFDILVHDGWNDETKSLKLVSGGERVWINECLTRAIALYLAGNTDRRLATLFCDEADGPLDPDRKRMFMAMKREVLRLGGYECEFFVSQTPELTMMADRVINLDDLAAVVEGAGA